MSSTAPISSELGLICELLAGCREDTGITIPRTKADALMRRLHLLRQTSAAMEHELGAYRIGQSNDAAAGIIDDLTTDVLREGADGKVVRPNFGGRR